MSSTAAQQLFEDPEKAKVHTLQSGNSGSFECHGQEIQVDNASPVASQHLCSDDCPSCSRIMVNPRSAAAVSLKANSASASSALVPSLFGISGISIAFVLVCAMVYCFGVRYRRWNRDKSGNETEEIVGGVLDEIAKYTIGDLEENSDEGFHGDYSDRSESGSSSDESAEELGMGLGMGMLRVVSLQDHDVPEMPNPSLYSSEEEVESDEEQCREDLIVARKTLSATALSGGSQLQSLPSAPSAKSLSTINEAVVERKLGAGLDSGSGLDSGCGGGGALRKHNPMLSGDSSDCKLSSDAAGNSSDLP